MTRYSRTSKYEDLRNKLQNDNEGEISTPSLSAFEKRLNSINANNFKAPSSYTEDDHDPIHARRREYTEQPKQTSFVQEKDDEDSVSLNTLPRTDHFGSDFRNEYLDEYIDEVRKYNADKGYAYSTDPRLNILHSIQNNQKKTPPTKPYPDEDNRVTTEIPSMTGLQGRFGRQEDTRQNVRERKEETADIPFFSNERAATQDFPSVDMPEEDTNHTGTMTKEDIAAEVQNLIREQNPDTAPDFERTDDRELNYHFAAERNARQQLLNETSQMRAQLDDYEDNLSEVNDKMKRTNQTLNIILIVLIVALGAVLAVVLYWIISLKGF